MLVSNGKLTNKPFQLLQAEDVVVKCWSYTDESTSRSTGTESRGIGWVPTEASPSRDNVTCNLYIKGQ